MRVNLVQKMKLKTINIIDMVVLGKGSRLFKMSKVFHLAFSGYLSKVWISALPPQPNAVLGHTPRQMLLQGLGGDESPQ